VQVGGKPLPCLGRRRRRERGAPNAKVERRPVRLDLARWDQVSLTAVPLALTISMERPSLPRCS
jgi:hypothetical protein